MFVTSTRTKPKGEKKLAIKEKRTNVMTFSPNTPQKKPKTKTKYTHNPN